MIRRAAASATPTPHGVIAGVDTGAKTFQDDRAALAQRRAGMKDYLLAWPALADAQPRPAPASAPPA